MTPFTETPHCTSRKKCHLCRGDNRQGEQFRRGMATNYEMPGEGLFACPFGVMVTLRVSAPVPLSVLERDEGRAQICEQCDECQGVTRWAGRFRLYQVKCRACGCGARKLADGCPAGRH
jgi:hypothetical protein